MSTLHTAIRSLLDAQERAWAAGDAEAFADAALPHIVFTNVTGLFCVGRAGFVARHQHIFETFYKGSTLRQTVEQITAVKPDVAIVNTMTKVTGFGTLPPAIAAQDGVLTTRLEQVFVHDGNGWKIASFHNVVVHPGAAAPQPDPRSR